MPDLSIILACHNRPDFLRRAIVGIARQDHASYQVILVDDSSSLDARARMKQIIDGLDIPVRLIHIGSPGAKGCGPSAARNVGARETRSDFIAFLDDDDEWIASDHLSHAMAAFKAKPSLDYYCANQEGVSVSGVVTITDWLPGLSRRAKAAEGSILFSAKDLLRGDTGFPHLNTTVIRRSLFEDIGGFDESLRYSGDLDFSRRALDITDGGLYRPDCVARHYIPDQQKKENASTRLTEIEKRQTLVRFMTDLGHRAKNRAVKDRCLHDAGDELRHLADLSATAGDAKNCRHFARRALLMRFGFKWLLVTLGLHLRLPLLGRK